MRALYCAASLLTTFASANAGESLTPQSLAILFHFDQPYAHQALKEVERELRVLGDTSVKLEWHDRSTAQKGASFSNIVVLNFRGTCDPRSDSAFNGPLDGWLARMHVSDGVVLPFGEVNCDLVRALMNDGEAKEKPNDKKFGRALARVLAHELYHFVMQSTEHAAQGIEKASFSRADLLSTDLSLDHPDVGR